MTDEECQNEETWEVMKDVIRIVGFASARCEHPRQLVLAVGTTLALLVSEYATGNGRLRTALEHVRRSFDSCESNPEIRESLSALFHSGRNAGLNLHVTCVFEEPPSGPTESGSADEDKPN